MQEQMYHNAAPNRLLDAVVIGGGLLGLEAARGLLTHGCEVHLVHIGKYLMEQQLDAEAAGILKRNMEGMGVHVHLEKSTTAVLGDGRVQGLAFKDGSSLDCELLVISAGIRPNAEIGMPMAKMIMVVRRALVPDQPRRAKKPGNQPPNTLPRSAAA